MIEPAPETNAPPLVALFGPTGSGKSSLALAIAQACRGVIINADSRQIYQHIPILSAQPTMADQALVPHQLYGFLAPTQAYSAAQYATAAAAAVQAAWQAGQLPIVCGGTGLYLRALLEGLAPIPPTPPALLADLQHAWASGQAAALYRQLQQFDPVLAARLPPHDQARILRGLAVYQLTQCPLSQWQQAPRQRWLPQARVLRLAINLPVALLNARLADRLAADLQRGLWAEVEALQAWPATAPALQALGVQALWACQHGQATTSDALAAYLQQQRQYAKRQRTWLRHQYQADVIQTDLNAATTLQAVQNFCAQPT